MLVGVSKTETIEHISQFDPARTRDEGATIFILGSLDVDIRAFIADKSIGVETTSDGTQKIAQYNGTRVLNACRFGLKSWENFQDKNKNDIPLTFERRIIAGKEYQAVSNDSLNALGMALITEIGTEILNNNALQDTVAKK